jgi:TatA/E family protein of Tat protein translocase
VFGLGPGEMMILFIIVLLIFGPSQLPKLARGLGNAMREFRKAQHEFSNELNRDSTESKPDAPHAAPESKPPESKPPENKPIQ